MVDTRIRKFRKSVENELSGDILKYWMENTLDYENGGFYGYVSCNNLVDKNADKGCILNTRILWTFSRAYNYYKDNKYFNIAQRAYDYLVSHFWDNRYSGLYWSLDYTGRPVETKKQIYCQAFGIYAFTEFYKASGDCDSLIKAQELFRLIEEKSSDQKYGGYYEAYSEDWGIIEDLRLSENDLNEKKSMNTHLHILEAYTNLYRAWTSKELYSKLKQLLIIITERILNKKTWHFNLFFDEQWNIKSDIISYGHDIEGAWLLLEAAAELKDTAYLEEMKATSLKMVDAVYKESIDKDSGIINEYRNGHIDTDKIWWVQAEGLVGLFNAFEITNDGKYLDGVLGLWRYIESEIIDKRYGEWLWRVTDDKHLSPKDVKVGMWKCPYHNSRACFEILERIRREYKDEQ